MPVLAGAVPVQRDGALRLKLCRSRRGQPVHESSFQVTVGLWSRYPDRGRACDRGLPRVSGFFPTTQNCGSACISKRRAVWNRRISIGPNSASDSGRSTMGSSTVRSARFRRLVRVCSGTQLLLRSAGGPFARSPVEQGHQLAGQQEAFFLAEAADNGAIQRQILGLRRVGQRHQYVAGMHVGMEKLSRNTWVKKISTPISASVFRSIPAGLHGGNIGNRHAIDTFHGQHVGVLRSNNLRHV